MPEDMKPIPDPDPPLEAESIKLRWLRVEDAEVVALACRDPDIPRWTFMEEGLTIDGAVAWIERSHEGHSEGLLARFAVLEDDALVGQVGVVIDWDRRSGETFYWVSADSRGRGVATNALALVSGWSFETLGLERLELFAHPENHRSQRVAERVGYVREGLLRSHQPFKGRRMDSVVYSLLPSDLDER